MGIQKKKQNLSNEKCQIKCYYKDTIDPKTVGKIYLWLPEVTMYVLRHMCIQNNMYNTVII